MGIEGTERVETVIVGGGQAGLATGYFLQRGRPSRDPGRPRAGRRRVADALGLAAALHVRRGTTACPASASPHPGGPSRRRTRWRTTWRRMPNGSGSTSGPAATCRRSPGRGIGSSLTTAGGRLEADNVVVATGANRVPQGPPFASELDPSIVQLHSSEYRRPSQLQRRRRAARRRGELGGRHRARGRSRTHDTWLSGTGHGAHPGPIEQRRGKYGFRRDPLPRPPRAHDGDPDRAASVARSRGKGDPLVRVKPKELLAAGVERVARVAGVREGKPLLEDGRVLDVTNVIWCTGFRSDFSWIDLPVFGEDGEPLHDARRRRPSRVCTSSGCRSSTRRPLRCCRASAGITPTSRSGSPRAITARLASDEVARRTRRHERLSDHRERASSTSRVEADPDGRPRRRSASRAASTLARRGRRSDAREPGEQLPFAEAPSPGWSAVHAPRAVPDRALGAHRDAPDPAHGGEARTRGLGAARGQPRVLGSSPTRSVARRRSGGSSGAVALSLSEPDDLRALLRCGLRPPLVTRQRGDMEVSSA